MKLRNVFIIASALVLFNPQNAFPFRCGSGLVSTGDTKTQVLVTCGKPTSKESTCEGRKTTSTIEKNGSIRKQSRCYIKLKSGITIVGKMIIFML